MKLWMLTLIFNIGTPDAHSIIVSRTIPTQIECFLRANHEILVRKHRYITIAATCEPSMGEVA